MSLKRPDLKILAEYPCFTCLPGCRVCSFGIKAAGPANTAQLCCSIGEMSALCHRRAWSLAVSVWDVWFHVSQGEHCWNAVRMSRTPPKVSTLSVSHLSLHAQDPLILCCYMLLADVYPDSRLCIWLKSHMCEVPLDQIPAAWLWYNSEKAELYHDFPVSTEQLVPNHLQGLNKSSIHRKRSADGPLRLTDLRGVTDFKITWKVIGIVVPLFDFWEAFSPLSCTLIDDWKCVWVLFGFFIGRAMKG